MASTTTPERRRESGSMMVPRSFADLMSFDPFDLFRSAWGSSVSPLPGLSVSRTEKGYTVEIPVPGYKPNQIEVTYNDGVLSISGNSEKRSFTRSLMLPEEIDPESVQARVQDGLLTLSLNRHPERQPKKIPVQST